MPLVDKPRYIDVLSDSTGETAEKVVRAALLQFPQAGAQIRLHTRVRTKEVARPVLERAAREGALLVFTVVSPELREFVHGVTAELKIEAIDVIGSLIGKLGTFLEREPINTPSAMLPLSDEYFRRIEAVEFTVKSDDGKEPRNFKKADIVLPLAVALFRFTSPAMNLAVVVYLAWLFGIQLTPWEMAIGLAVALAAALSSVSLPGSISFVTSIAPIAISMGVPVAPLGLLVAVETFPDIFRTLGNVVADVAATRYAANGTDDNAPPAGETP